MPYIYVYDCINVYMYVCNCMLMYLYNCILLSIIQFIVYKYIYQILSRAHNRHHVARVAHNTLWRACSVPHLPTKKKKKNKTACCSSCSKPCIISFFCPYAIINFKSRISAFKNLIYCALSE